MKVEVGNCRESMASRNERCHVCRRLEGSRFLTKAKDCLIRLAAKPLRTTGVKSTNVKEAQRGTTAKRLMLVLMRQAVCAKDGGRLGKKEPA